MSPALPKPSSCVQGLGKGLGLEIKEEERGEYRGYRYKS